MAICASPLSPAADPPVSIRRLRLFRRDTRGAAAVEFALVSGLFMLTIVFVLIVALVLYFSQALDFAVSKAARQVMVGNVQKNSVTKSDFRTTMLCPYLPASIRCGDVIVNLATLDEAAGPAGYYAFVNGGATALNTPALTNSTAQYAVGAQGAYQYLQVVYPVTMIPSAFARILGTATYNNSPAYLVVSTAAFRNEQY